MTLRGRLTAAFLLVVLGPVLLGSLFVAVTVGAVTRERTAERLDHATVTVRTGIGAICRQLQTAADAVAVVGADDRRAVADQLIRRGLASEVAIRNAGDKSDEAAGWQDCRAPSGAAATAISAVAEAGEVRVTAARSLDNDLLTRLAASSGASVTEPGSPDAARRQHQKARTLAAGPDQPVPLLLGVPRADPTFLYAVLAAVVLVAAALGVIVARWLARSTTRPLGDLAWAADRVADGELDTRVPILRPDELGRVAATFNRMTRELQAYVQALTASRDQLRGHLAILGETLAGTHDLHRILPVILRTALAATGARAGLVLLTDPESGELAAQCGFGLTGDWDVPDAQLTERRIPIGRGMLGEVAASAEARRGHGTAGPDEPPCLTYLAVPISGAAAGETLGVLALYDRVGTGAFDDADLHTVRKFAGQAGVAVHNVRVHEEARRLSLTDPLTGLWNYRHLRESLAQQVDRAARFGRTLTVLVLDLDHFKGVNDTHGHAAGDAVLAEFARRLRLGLREVDFAFRQGGEEFVVLLPETDAYGGQKVAERLGAAVRDRPVPVEGGEVPMSVSIGVAVYPQHAGTAQLVLEAADAALYAAKRAGRDTYRIAGTAGVSKSAISPRSPGEPDGKSDHTAAMVSGTRQSRHTRGR